MKTHLNRLSILALLAACLMLTGCERVKSLWPFGRGSADDDIINIDPNYDSPPDLTGAFDGTEIYNTGSLPPDDIAVTSDEDLLGLALPEPIRRDPEGLILDLPIIYFDFDSFGLGASQRETLDTSAEWLINHLSSTPNLTIRVEGHCDERGTDEYNYTLGEKRAQAVREYLASQGVDPDRLQIWSWGELRPAVQGTGEAALSQNRRVQFALWTEGE